MGKLELVYDLIGDGKYGAALNHIANIEKKGGFDLSTRVLKLNVLARLDRTSLLVQGARDLIVNHGLSLAKNRHQLDNLCGALLSTCQYTEQLRVLLSLSKVAESQLAEQLRREAFKTEICLACELQDDCRVQLLQRAYDDLGSFADDDKWGHRLVGATMLAFMGEPGEDSEIPMALKEIWRVSGEQVDVSNRLRNGVLTMVGASEKLGDDAHLSFKEKMERHMLSLKERQEAIAQHVQGVQLALNLYRQAGNFTRCEQLLEENKQLMQVGTGTWLLSKFQLALDKGECERLLRELESYVGGITDSAK